MERVLEFFREPALLTPDNIELAWSRPNTRNVRESVKLLKIRYARDLGTFDNIKCFFSAAFGELLPIAEKKLKIIKSF